MKEIDKASDEASAAIRELALAALENYDFDRDMKEAITAQVVAHCQELPKYSPALPALRPSSLVMTRKSKDLMIRDIARVLIADLSVYVGELTGFFVRQIVDLEIARRSTSNGVSNE
ncbi:MAG: hypothetical protein B7Y73_08510 [Acidocella sp. 35-58-6]|nr:MAG: hypothetical protein B7Y73_08510 [Acidocella sp. 35-58-6]